MESLRFARRGVVLIWALVTLAVTTTILGALGSYYAGAGRVAKIYMDKTTARFGAQNSIDMSVSKPLDLAIGQFNDGLGVGNSVSDVKGTVQKALEDAGFVAVDEGNTYKNENAGLTVTSLNNLNAFTDDKKDVSAQIEIYSTSSFAGSGSVKLRQVITIEYREPHPGEEGYDEHEEVLSNNSHPIFRYVYFANNYGHLESKGIVANGNVGANDKFTIDGATINGYVSAYSRTPNDPNAVILKSTEQVPRMWPYDTYQKQVAAQYKLDGTDFFTPVRPTNPYRAGGTNMVWKGGYEPPGLVSDDGSFNDEGEFTPGPNPYASSRPNPYGVSAPDPVDDPGDNPLDDFWAEMPNIDSYTPGKKDKDSTKKTKYNSYVSAITRWYNSSVGQSWKTKAPSVTDSKYYKNKSVKYSNFYWNSSNSRNNNYKDAINNWVSVCKKDPTQSSVYREWKENSKAYEDYKEAYKGWLKGSNTWYLTTWKPWQDNYDAYEEKIRQIKEDIANGRLFVELTKDTTHEFSDGRSTNIINVTTNFVVMPSVSDDDIYRAFCQTNHVSYTNVFGRTFELTGGTLSCPNKYVATTTTTNYDRWGFVKNVVTSSEEKNIVWQYAYNDKVEKRGKTFDKLYDTTYATGADSPMKRTLTEVNVTGGYNANIMPFKVGSDDAKFRFSSLTDAERGCVILIGSSRYPIEIHGPVYFDGDVIIRGFVSGQGTIYAGRNIHIVGDITYLNPPTWPHSSAGLLSQTPTEVAKNNCTRDLLSLMARGNIVVGDYTQEAWKKQVQNWIADNHDGMVDTSLSGCNAVDDSEIGYPASLYSFRRKYMDLELNVERNPQERKVEFDYAASGYKDDDSYYGFFSLYYARLFRQEAKLTSGNLRYYESRLGSEVISGLMQSGVSSGGSGWPSSWILRWIYKYILGYRPTVATDSGTTVDYSQLSGSADAAGDITQIDAVLFANHGIFGRVGGAKSYDFTLNGAMICRDEGLLPAFKNLHANASVWLNWDMRIASDSAEGNGFVGLDPTTPPETTDTRKKRFFIHISDWQQVK